MNDLFPTHYDPGQLRLRCERMGLSCAFGEHESLSLWMNVWRLIRSLFQ